MCCDEEQAYRREWAYELARSLSPGEIERMIDEYREIAANAKLARRDRELASLRADALAESITEV